VETAHTFYLGKREFMVTDKGTRTLVGVEIDDKARARAYFKMDYFNGVRSAAFPNRKWKR
jgi:hypothetical protein